MQNDHQNNNTSISDNILEFLNYFMEVYIAITISSYFHSFLFGVLAFVGIMFLNVYLILLSADDLVSLLNNKDKLQELVKNNLWKIALCNLSIIVLLKFTM